MCNSEEDNKHYDIDFETIKKKFKRADYNNINSLIMYEKRALHHYRTGTP